MQTLELDFKARGRRSPWVGRALMAGALVFAAHVTTSYMHARGLVDEGEARLARLDRETSRGAPGAGASPEELRIARETVERLSLAWGNLFQALEAASKGTAGQDISLLAIEPDARAGTALIGGEAKDYAAVLGYVSRLASARTLRDVHLVRHEVRPGDSRRPIAFTVSASWKGQR
jgi:hypothetical protein